MASQTKQSAKAEFNTFVQGLITEASPLNFPANASVDEANFELNRDGARDRRRGMDYEEPFALIPTSPSLSIPQFPSLGYGAFVWEAPGGFVSEEFLIIQIGNQLSIFDNQKDSISFGGAITTIIVTDFADDVRYSCGVVNGKLILASGATTYFLVDYTGGAAPGSFLTEYQTLKVRDLWGVQAESPLDVQFNRRDTRLPNDIPRHTYNLMNQGWAIPRRAQIKFSGLNPPVIIENPGLVNPIGYFRSQKTGTPAQTESVYTGLQFQPIINNVTNAPTEQMILDLYDESRNTTGEPARGFFVIDLLRRGQSRLEAQIQHALDYPDVAQHFMTDGPADFTTGGPSVVRGYAGRMFFAGFSGEVVDGDSKSPSLESYVLFSQLVKNTADISKCYQEGDPTSREASDIVDTDGGFVRISGCAKIVGMRALGASLMVFATNGIWEINGGSDFGFSATNFKVTKLSSIGAFSESSIVDQVGKLFFWSLDGIYMVGADQFQVNSVQSLTQTTIQTLYDNIPTGSKEKAVGVYDAFTKKVRWVYNEGTLFSGESRSKELVFDTVLGAFYLNTLGNVNNEVEVVSAFVTPPFRTGDALEVVAVGDDEVFADTDLVLIDAETTVSGLQSIKYLAIVDVAGAINYTFSEYNNIEFTDWEKTDGTGVDAKAFLLTGSQIAGDSSIAKQIPYLTMHFRRTENGFTGDDEVANPSSCFVRSQWNFSNTANSNKWGSLFQAYRYTNSFLITNPTYDSGFELITTKNKLRGRGRSFSMYLESEPKKNLRLVGWNLAVNGNATT